VDGTSHAPTSTETSPETNSSPSGLSMAVQTPLLPVLSSGLLDPSSSLAASLDKFEELERIVTTNTMQISAHNGCIKELLYQSANQSDISDMLCNIKCLNEVIVSGIKESPFGLGLLPKIKPVAHKLVLATKVHIGAIKTAVIQKYPLPKYGCLPDLKIIFNSSEAGTLFRADANKLRKDKVGEWASIYVNNEVTKATRVRIALLQSIASALQKLPANVGKTVFVTKFESRPQLCFKVGDKIESRLFYIDAIQKYQTLLEERLQENHLAKHLFQPSLFSNNVTS